MKQILTTIVTVMVMGCKTIDNEQIYVKNGKLVRIDNYKALINDFPESQVFKEFEENIAVPGFIEHHIHPFLSSLTMNSTIISIDNWNLNGMIRKGVLNSKDYISELSKSLNQKENLWKD